MRKVVVASIRRMRSNPDQMIWFPRMNRGTASGLLRPLRGLATTAFILLLTTSCTLYQKPDIAPIKIPNHLKITTITYRQLKNHWWENFHDLQLNKFVCLATKYNLNYQVAIKNIQIAQTYVDQAASALLPHVNLNYNLSRNKLSPNSFAFIGGQSPTPISTQMIQNPFNLEELFASVTYELDVWNQIGNSVNQAKANVVVSEANSNVVKLTLISSVANTYFQITTLNTTLANLKQQYDCAKEILRLTMDQYKAGLIDIAVVDDARNQVEGIKANIDNLKKQKQILTNTMAYLLGMYPESFNCPIENKLKTPPLTTLIPEGTPCSILANRPDIRQAFYQIVSYGYLEKQNIANFLPAFNLTGNGGFATTILSQFITKRSVFWNYALNVLQPVFDYGLRMSEYQQSKLQFEAATLSYKNTVVNAFNEVDSTLAAYKEDYQALHANQNQLRNTKEKLDASNAQFHGGLIDYSAYLTIKLSYLQAAYNVENQELTVVEDIIQVYKALGLGLEPPCFS